MRIILLLFIVITLFSISSSLMAETTKGEVEQWFVFEGIAYTTLGETSNKNVKCSLDVRLGHRMPEDMLSRLALKLRNNETGKKEIN